MSGPNNYAKVPFWYAHRLSFDQIIAFMDMTDNCVVYYLFEDLAWDV